MEKRVKGAGILIALIVIVACVIRVMFGHELLLSGDEVGVGVLQSTGQALDYDAIPIDKLHSMEDLKGYVDYSPDHSLGDVCESMRYSGMHPPFYYFLLHYVIRFVGNDLLVLRILSIVFSVASLWLVYRLGRELFSEAAGLLGALLLAASPYCLQYGVLVRPYPLLMFLSLLSTLQLTWMIKDKGLSLKSRSLYLYMLVCIVGLYSLYHFLFVVAAHFVFVLFASTRSVKEFLLNCVPFAIIGAAFTPWLPSLQDQLRIITNESYSYYFHGDYTIWGLMIQVVDLQLWQYPLVDLLPVEGANILRIILLALAFVAMLCGAFMAIRSKNARAFLLAIVGYIIIHYAGDRIMDTQTLAHNKFEFFLIPAIVLFLAYGICSLTRCNYLKVSLAVILIAFCVAGSTRIYTTKLNFDGPSIIKTFKNEMEANYPEGSRSLVLINTHERRQVLSFAHAVNIDADVALMVEEDIEQGLAKLTDLHRYDRIFLVDLHIAHDKKPNFTNDDRRFIAQHVRKQGFGSFTYLHKQPKNKLVIFEEGGS